MNSLHAHRQKAGADAGVLGATRAVLAQSAQGAQYVPQAHLLSRRQAVLVWEPCGDEHAFVVEEDGSVRAVVDTVRVHVGHVELVAALAARVKQLIEMGRHACQEGRRSWA